MTDSGDVDLHLPLFDDAKGSKVGRLLGSGAAASQGGCVGAVCYNFETGSRGGGGWRRIDTVKSGCPWSKSFNLCQTGGPKSLQICRRRRRRRRERSDRVEHTKKKKSDTARGRKSQKQEKKETLRSTPAHHPSPPPSAFARAASATLAPIRKRKEKKSDLIRSTKTPLFAVVPASQHVLRPHSGRQNARTPIMSFLNPGGSTGVPRLADGSGLLSRSRSLSCVTTRGGGAQERAREDMTGDCRVGAS